MGSIVTGGLQSYGQLFEGNAQADAAKYNAYIQRQNAAIATTNQNIASQSGAEQASLSEQRTRATSGAIQANQGASGVDVNSGSAVDTRQSAAEIGELDALTIRSNATREAYGYENQAVSDTAQANLDTAEAKNDITASEIGATGTFIGAQDKAAANFLSFQMSGGFGG